MTKQRKIDKTKTILIAFGIFAIIIMTLWTIKDNSKPVLKITKEICETCEEPIGTNLHCRDCKIYSESRSIDD